MRRVPSDDGHSMDEEELEDLQQPRRGPVPIRRPQPTNGFAALLDDRHCGREGYCEIVLPLAVLACFAIGVIIYNLLRFSRVEPCDDDSPMAKHFYCFNRSAAPGVHMDKVR